MIKRIELTIKEVVELFEYGKNNEGYWDKPKLHKQVVNKTFLIAEIFYLRYSLLFLFDNTTSYLVYVNNALCNREMNKESGKKQI